MQQHWELSIILILLLFAPSPVKADCDYADFTDYNDDSSFNLPDAIFLLSELLGRSSSSLLQPPRFQNAI